MNPVVAISFNTDRDSHMWVMTNLNIVLFILNDDLAFDHYDIILSTIKKLQVELQRRRFDNV